MRTPAGAIVGLAVLILLVALVWLVVVAVQNRPARQAAKHGESWSDRLVTWVERRTTEQAEADKRKVRETARWQSFSRQSDRDPQQWDVGIELVADDGVTVLDSRAFKTLYGREFMSDLLDLEGQAQAWAEQLNAQVRR
ncbi:hypothetical protein EV383_4463 [Pseudonocardia sediminis]|uniref:Uncharacterized protein n=1 Tax=Pseudonocardia sediminis TaxID=1397368 RepID=A0A4Q7V247_PSEST|nr:hypothetical protein [Pseudonocardia sediminis]RZT87538.1 hypothetical protein EV383_4463 [Pseudonocardia sediminis]